MSGAVSFSGRPDSVTFSRVFQLGDKYGIATRLLKDPGPLALLWEQGLDLHRGLAEYSWVGRTSQRPGKLIRIVE
jgi:hypothetical protein